MADEIRTSAQFSIRKGNFNQNFPLGPVVDDQAGTGGGTPGTVSIGTSEEDISFGDVVPGYVIIENNGATNFVTYGPKSGGSMVAFGKILPGQFAIFYLAGSVTIRAIADTAAVECSIRGYDA